MSNKAVHAIFFFLATILFAGSLCAQLLIEPPKQLSPPNLFDAEGVSIVINPLNPLQIAARSDVNYFYYSTDKGQSWSGNGFTSTFGNTGDPSLTCDAKGNIYYAHLSDNNLDRIVIQKSIDGGLQYSTGTFTGLRHNPRQEYKEWITSDLSGDSPYKNNLYLSWTEFDSYQSKFPQFDSSRILFSGSSDEGASWSLPVTVNDRQGDCADSSNTVEGARCTTSPNGDIYITWCGPDGLLFDKSTDGGKTFSKDKILSSLTPGWELNIDGIYKCNAFATPLCDISPSKHRGNLYVIFSDQRNRKHDCDIFLLRSTDRGDSWSAPLRINNDSTHTEQFLPSAAIDQTTGIIYCLFYDRRDHEGRNLTEVYLARSTDGGESFQNFRLNSTPFNPNNKIYLGDYTHIAAQNTYIYPAWTEIQGEANFTESIWSSVVIDKGALTTTELPRQKSASNFSLTISPNPARSQVHFNYSHQTNATASLEITDVMGRILFSISGNDENISSDVSYFPIGVYYCIAQCGTERVVQKFIVAR